VSEGVAVFAAALVGAPVLVAGVLKLASKSSAGALSDALVATGVRARRAHHIAGIAPWVEITLGSAAILQIGSPLVRPLLAMLCAAFLVVQVRLLRSTDAHHACACFGALDEAIGARLATLRALILLVGTVLVMVAGGLGGVAPGSSDAVPSAYGLLAGVLLAAALPLGAEIHEFRAGRPTRRPRILRTVRS